MSGVRVRYLVTARDLTGVRDEQYLAWEGMSLADLLDQVFKRHGVDFREGWLLSVNGLGVKPGTYHEVVLRPGDEILIIPMLSGG